jgi:hypothetical protein
VPQTPSLVLRIPRVQLRSRKEELHKRIRTKIDKHAESAGNKDCEGKRR